MYIYIYIYICVRACIYINIYVCIYIHEISHDDISNAATSRKRVTRRGERHFAERDMPLCPCATCHSVPCVAESDMSRPVSQRVTCNTE